MTPDIRSEFQRLAVVRARRQSQRRKRLTVLSVVAVVAVAALIVAVAPLERILSGTRVSSAAVSRVLWRLGVAPPDGVRGSVQGAVATADRETGRIRIGGGLAGLLSVPIVVTPETRIVVGDKEGGFGDIVEAREVIATYEVRTGTPEASRVEIVGAGPSEPQRVSDVGPAAHQPATPDATIAQPAVAEETPSPPETSTRQSTGEARRPLEAAALPGRTDRTSSFSPEPSHVLRADEGDLIVETTAQRVEPDLTAYTVRVHQPDGRPVEKANVRIRGRGANGARVAVVLRKIGEPGAYRAVVKRGSEITTGRIRIATGGRLVEVPLE